MSLLRGDVDSSWSLAGWVDALAAAARQAGRPGMIWLSGIAYQFVVLSWSFGSLVVRLVLRPEAEADFESFFHVRPLHGIGMEAVLATVRDQGLGAALLFAPIVLVVFRLAGGLARLSPPDRWTTARPGGRAPRVWRAWRAGRGTTLSAIGLWLLFVLMMVAATVLFAAPARLLLAILRTDALSPLMALTIGFLLLYGFLLSILFQLGLHSLVQNRRGAASALQHAWRIARNDPMATARATLVDAVLYLTVLVLMVATVLLQRLLQVPEALLLLPYLGLLGFGGCARSAFWARAYDALGGISTLGDGEESEASEAEPASRFGELG